MRARSKLIAALLAALLCAAAVGQEPAPAPSAPGEQPARQPVEPAQRFPGMDQGVNVALAERAGLPARKPYIDVESLGDLWNLILLTGGGIAGFVIGRNWDQIWGRRKA